MIKQILMALALMCASSGAMADEVTVREAVGSDGARLLVHSVDIAAEADRLWSALSTAEGWQSWAVPVAFVDFRIGGEFETTYSRAALKGDPANIRNRILAIVPGRMLVIQAVQAPPGFPHREILPDLWSVIEIEPLAAGRTRVTLTGGGYRTSPAHDGLFAFFRAGNAQALGNLRDSVEHGPINWAAIAAP